MFFQFKTTCVYSLYKHCFGQRTRCHSSEIRDLCLLKCAKQIINQGKNYYVARNEKRIQWVFKFQKYQNLEALCQVISSSINFLFLKSGVVIYEIFGECSIVLNSMYLCCIYICLLTSSLHEFVRYSDLILQR